MPMVQGTSQNDDSLNFTFGDNTLRLYKNPLGTVYHRNGDMDDLCVEINGFNLSLNKLILDTNSIKMTFHNGQ